MNAFEIWKKKEVFSSVVIDFNGGKTSTQLARNSKRTLFLEFPIFFFSFILVHANNEYVGILSYYQQVNSAITDDVMLSKWACMNGNFLDTTNATNRSTVSLHQFQCHHIKCVSLSKYFLRLESLNYLIPMFLFEWKKQKTYLCYQRP